MIARAFGKEIASIFAFWLLNCATLRKQIVQVQHESESAWLAEIHRTYQSNETLFEKGQQYPKYLASFAPNSSVLV